MANMIKYYVKCLMCGHYTYIYIHTRFVNATYSHRGYWIWSHLT